MKRVVAVPLVLLVFGTLFLTLLLNVQSRPRDSTVDLAKEKEESAHAISGFVLAETKQEELKSTDNRLFLEQECPEQIDHRIWSNEECLDAVERYVLEQPAYTLEFPGMVSRAAPFTYREMFENLRQDQELVIEALSNSQCRLLEGAIRTDLRELCNADAFYRYSRFAELCYSASAVESYLNLSVRSGPETAAHQFHLQKKSKVLNSTDREDGNFVQDADYKVKNSSRRKVLHDIWLQSREECPTQLDMDLLLQRSVGTNDNELLEWWSGGSKVEQRYLITHMSIAYNWNTERTREWMDRNTLWKSPARLQQISARLGFEWLVVEHKTFTTVKRDPEYLKSRYQLFPWMDSLPHALVVDSMFKYKEEEPLLHVVRGVVGMRKSGYEADLKGMVTDVCSNYHKRRDSKYDTCTTAVRGIEASLDLSSTEELKVLYEIEVLAMELDRYGDS